MQFSWPASFILRLGAYEVARGLHLGDFYFAIVFLFDVGEECGVGEVALPAGTDEGAATLGFGCGGAGGAVHDKYK
jgi:hypothetical protein